MLKIETSLQLVAEKVGAPEKVGLEFGNSSFFLLLHYSLFRFLFFRVFSFFVFTFIKGQICTRSIQEFGMQLGIQTACFFYRFSLLSLGS
jgi:hypothetical protein